MPRRRRRIHTLLGHKHTSKVIVWSMIVITAILFGIALYVQKA